MKVVAINGGPRKTWNTARMIEAMTDGCRAAGAEVSIHNLYDIDFRGCTSCFACKLLGGPSHAACGMRDDLTAVLNECLAADLIIVGSPVYFGDVTGELRSFLERLWFPGLAYDRDHRLLYKRRIQAKVILTSNASKKEYIDEIGGRITGTMSTFIGTAEMIAAVDTLQFDDYSKYDAAIFDVEAKRKRHEEVFTEDLKKAYKMGKDAIEEIAEYKEI